MKNHGKKPKKPRQPLHEDLKLDLFRQVMCIMNGHFQSCWVSSGCLSSPKRLHAKRRLLQEVAYIMVGMFALPTAIHQ